MASSLKSDFGLFFYFNFVAINRFKKGRECFWCKIDVFRLLRESVEKTGQTFFLLLRLKLSKSSSDSYFT